MYALPGPLSLDTLYHSLLRPSFLVPSYGVITSFRLQRLSELQTRVSWAGREAALQWMRCM